MNVYLHDMNKNWGGVTEWNKEGNEMGWERKPMMIDGPSHKGLRRDLDLGKASVYVCKGLAPPFVSFKNYSFVVKKGCSKKKNTKASSFFDSMQTNQTT